MLKSLVHARKSQLMVTSILAQCNVSFWLHFHVMWLSLDVWKCMLLICFSLTVMQTVGSGSMLLMKTREDEASVASTPHAKQLSNQASDYISSPMKTKTITGTLQGQGNSAAVSSSKMVKNSWSNFACIACTNQSKSLRSITWIKKSLNHHLQQVVMQLLVVFKILLLWYMILKWYLKYRRKQI